MHSFMKNAEHAIGHFVKHKMVEGMKEGPITTMVGAGVGLTAGVALTVATGGLALAPLASAACGGALTGLCGGALLGNATRK